MAFRKKAELILQYEPDILIIPECEHPDKLKFPGSVKLPTDIVWYDDNPNKGLGIFSYGDFKLQLLPIHNPNLKTILPISVMGGAVEFTLFGIWANNPLDINNQFIEQIWKAIHYYDDLITHEKTILIGDFNSNTIWDRKHRKENHSAVVEILESRKVKSVYHHHFQHMQGKEEHATFHLYKHFDKPYHIDYCFASDDFISKLNSVEIGGYSDWKTYSDHLPLIVNFDI